MPDLTRERLAQLNKHRLPMLNLSGETVLPAYTGESILNIPSAVCQLLGAPKISAFSLKDDLIRPLGEGIQRIVLILMDSLALHRLQLWLQSGEISIWADLAEQGLLAPLTSVVPSTTSSALTTLWTGRSPVEHGVLGYEMWMKEYGMIVNMIQLAPATFMSSPGSLSRTGFQPEAFLPYPNIAQHLSKYDITVHAFQHHTIARSGLTKMLMNGAQVHSFGSFTDLWVDVRQLIESTPKEKQFSWVYWGGLDYLGHLHGPEDERILGDFRLFSQAFRDFFLTKLSSDIRKDTVVILLADHGMVATDPDPFYELNNHPGLARRLYMVPTGENRLMYLYSRPGQVEAVREYIERTWLGQFQILDSVYAAESGLFGSGEGHPNLLERLGNLIVLPGESMYLWWATKENFLRGRHGGLHPDEMLVPYLAVRLR